ncbi:MAG TPA: hypothetical protein DCW90_06570 [Lachnospiraceae bacterium]|nr:VanZ family protein [uncultured Lachnoclostridium sp.]HAU85161.1 hypothetical protein [Lachnospiraceae bacterium]
MFTYGYLFYIPITVVFMLSTIILGVIRKRPFGFYLCGCIICVYLNLVIKEAIFPIYFDGRDLFITVRHYVSFDLSFLTLDKLQIVGNILLTLPIGFCIPFYINVDRRKNYIISGIISLSIEFVQLILIITVHTIDIKFDVKDLILNLSGALLGCLIFDLFSLITSKIFHEFIEKDNDYIDIFSYILIICDNYTKGKKSIDNLQS